MGKDVEHAIICLHLVQKIVAIGSPHANSDDYDSVQVNIHHLDDESIAQKMRMLLIENDLMS